MVVERKAYLDYLRGLAAIAVIVIHVSANNWRANYGSIHWLVFTAYEGVCRVAVPLFFMISGCLFLDKERNRTIKDLYTKTIKRLVVFLLFWAVAYKVLQFPTEGTFVEKMGLALSEIVVGNTQSHLWYIYAIIGLYIISPMLKIFANHASQKQLLYAITCCFVLGPVCAFCKEIPALEFLANHLIKLKDGMEIGYIGFFLLGYYIDNYEIKKKTRIALYFIGTIGLIVSIALVMWDCILNYSPLERFWKYTMPGMVLAAVAVFVFFKYRKIQIKLIDGFLKKVAKYSLGIYGCHFVFIILLWRMGITTFAFHWLIGVPLISFVVFICSFITSYLIQKVPCVGKYLA